MRYYPYSEYLKNKYGEKVYKLPVNLPVSCPNRMDGDGCAFCAGVGTGFEALDSAVGVKDQLERTKELIQKKYHAKKYIAYFQNYTNTFMPVSLFRTYLREAMQVEDIVEISISTRPDCITREYLDIMKEIQQEFGVDINIELGLQTINYHTLEKINRGHGLAEFIQAVLLIKEYAGFTICTHVILNLPGDDLLDIKETARVLAALHIDIVKLHSLYIAKGTKLAHWYEEGSIKICSKEEYFERVMTFLEQIPKYMVVERLFSRVPEKDALFSNWETSWWKLKDELEQKMDERDCYQGKHYNYLDGAGLKKLK